MSNGKRCSGDMESGLWYNFPVIIVMSYFSQPSGIVTKVLLPQMLHSFNLLHFSSLCVHRMARDFILGSLTSVLLKWAFKEDSSVC